MCLCSYGLSEIINHLLANTSSAGENDDDGDAAAQDAADSTTRAKKARPFDFLIDNEFLRTTLKRMLALKNVSTVRVARARARNASPRSTTVSFAATRRSILA